MSLAERPPVVAPSLREIAAQAWQNQQTEAAECRRLEIERKRNSLIQEAMGALSRTFVAAPANAHQGVDWTTISEAQCSIVGGDERVAERVDLCSVAIVFLGEHFEYRRGGGARNEWSLYHEYVCPDQTCGLVHESRYPIESLADLGSWLADAAGICQHSTATS